MKSKEKIHAFDVVQPKLTKTGFIIFEEYNLYLVSIKGGFFGGTETGFPNIII